MCYSIQIDKDIREMAKLYDAFVSDRTYEFFNKNSQANKLPDEHGRVFPNVYAPVIIGRKEQREIVPLRYNLLPHFSETEKYRFFNHKKNKYEELKTYNAKIENIQKTKAFSKLFLKRHCIVPIKSFFEWVEVEDKATQVKFLLDESKPLFAAGLWDHWGEIGVNKGVNSFAIITTAPREEVLAVGHDRSPLLLNNYSIDQWLFPEKSGESDIWDLISDPISDKLNHDFNILPQT